MGTADLLLRLADGLCRAPGVSRLLGTPADGPRSDAATYAAWDLSVAPRTMARFGPHGDVRSLRVADVGCGFGGTAVHCALSGAASVAAFEADPLRASAAGELARSKGAREVAVGVADAGWIPLANGWADRVLLIEVLEHLEDPRGALVEARRILARRGTVNVTFPPWGSPWGAHLRPHVRVPWAQRMFREEVLAGRWRDRARRDGGTSLLGPGRRDVARTGASLADLTGVRPLSVTRFEQLAADAGLRPVLFDLHTPGRLLDRVARRGLLREVAVTRVTAVLVPAEDV